MDRREALKRVALLLGGAISAPVMSGVLSGCRPGPEPFVPQTLTLDQNELVAHLAEMIIPTTDTPGARAARVHEFIDLMLTDWFPEDERAHYLSGLATVDQRSQADYGTPFLQATEAQQVALLTKMEDEALSPSENADGPPFFMMMKQLTLVGYYTSEIGATQELQWLAAPGRYDGCVPLSEVGRAWA